MKFEKKIKYNQVSSQQRKILLWLLGKEFTNDHQHFSLQFRYKKKTKKKKKKERKEN